MSNQSEAIWKLGQWPIVPGDVIHHLNHEDIRRFIYLASIGFGKPAIHSSFSGNPYITSQNYLNNWEDMLLPYPTSDIVYDTTDKLHNIDWASIKPGSISCWYEYNFSYEVLEVDTSTNPLGEFKFSLGSQISSYGLFTQTGSTISPTSGTEQWYAVQDDFRIGTPFKINSTSSNWEQVNNGFYRVGSLRVSGSYLYITPTDLEGNSVQLTSCSGFSEVDAICDFGGDWWIFRGNHGSSGSAYNGTNGDLHADLANISDLGYDSYRTGRWWSNKDMYHRYPLDGPDVLRGPNDGRPPTGGILAVDYNGDWVRGFNASVYHCFDTNSHRFMTYGDFAGSRTLGEYDFYTAVFPVSDYLPFPTDPKEIIEPKFYLGDLGSKWKYKSKVQIDPLQITDPDSLGPYDSCMETGYSTGTGDSDHHGASWSKQYQEIHQVEIGSMGYHGEAGWFPSQHYTSKWEDKWSQGKFNGAVQNMIELIAQKQVTTMSFDGVSGYDFSSGFSGRTWVMKPDEDYIDNWLWYHENTTAPVAHRGYLESKYSMPSSYTTYGDILDWGGTSKAWLPKLNPSQKQWAALDDVFWGENESAIELLLKKLGSDYYDWVFDKSDTKWTWKQIMDERWEIKQDTGTYNESSSCNSVTGLDNWTDFAEACYPVVEGTWRRTWKYTLGHYEDIRIDGSSADPCGMQTYWFDSNSRDVRMPGRSILDTSRSNAPQQDTSAEAMSIPAITDFGTALPSYTVESGALISFSGEQATPRPGYKIWSFTGSDHAIDAVTTVYTVKTRRYDSTAGKTFVLLDAVPTGTLYCDTQINERHFGDFATPAYYDRVYRILNHCREILNLLTCAQCEFTYHKLIRSIQASLDKSSFGDAYSWVWTSIPTSATKEEALAIMFANQQSWYATNYPDGMEDWITTGSIEGVGQGWKAYIDSYSGYWKGGVCIERAGMVVDVNTYQDVLGISPFEAGYTTYVLLALTANNAGLISVTSDYDTGTGIYSNFEQQAHDPVFLFRDGSSYGTEYLYEHLEGGTNGIIERPTEYVSVPLQASNITGTVEISGETCNVIEFLPPWGNPNQLGPQSGVNGIDDVPVCIWHMELEVVNQPLYAEVDWSLYNNCSFKRLYERCDLVFGDLIDSEPPVPDLKFVRGPELCDANLVYAGMGHSDYEDENYEPDWRIRAWVTLVQDEAGHGTLYDFTLETVVDETGVTGLSAWLTAMDEDDETYLYDKSLDGSQTLWQVEAFHDYSAIYMTCVAHDNYGSVSGGAYPDNYSDVVNSDNLALSEETMFFPHQAVIATAARITSDSINFQDMLTFKVPWYQDSLTYELEITDSAGTSVVSLPSASYASATFKDETQSISYRVRYWSDIGNYPGTWSSATIISNTV